METIKKLWDYACITWLTLTPKAQITALVALFIMFFAGAVLAQAGIGQVVNHSCDKSGGVNALVIAVAEPGLVQISWDNANVCGKVS
jgi:hypothetical protein